MSILWDKIVLHAFDIKQIVSDMLGTETIFVSKENDDGETNELEYYKKGDKIPTLRMFPDKTSVYIETDAEDFNNEREMKLKKRIGDAIGYPTFGKERVAEHFDEYTFLDRRSAVKALHEFFKDFERVREVSDEFLNDWIKEVEIYDDVDLESLKVELIDFAKRIHSR